MHYINLHFTYLLVFLQRTNPLYVGFDVSDDDEVDDDDLSHLHAAAAAAAADDDDDDVSCIRLRARRQRQRNQVTKKRRRIVQVVDSSTEDDQDASSNNHLRLTPAGKPDQNIIQQSVVAAGNGERKQPFPSSMSDQENPRSMQFSRSSRPNLIESGQTNLGTRSVPLLLPKASQPADYTGSGRTSSVGSGQPNFINRSVQSVQSKAAESTECFSNRADFLSVKSSHSVGSSDPAKVTNAVAANDVATFSLAFDDFLDSEGDEDIADRNTEYTRLKASKDRTPAFEKSDDNLPDVVRSSQVVGTCRETEAQTPRPIVSGQLGLIGSGQPSPVQTVPQTTVFGLVGSGQASSEPRPVQSNTTSAMSRSYSLTAPRPNCTTGSGRGSLSVSQQPSSFSSSEAERLREERIRLSRLKKEEFQRKHASTLSSNQPQTQSPSAGTASAKNSTSTGNSVDDPQNKLRILMDSRELSGAQVS